MTESVNQASDSVLLSTFRIRKKKCRVYFHRGTLVWETESAPYKRSTLPLADVVAVSYVHLPDLTQCCGLHALDDGKRATTETASTPPPRHNAFTLHYAEAHTKNRLRLQTVTLNHTDPRQVASWVKTIRNYLAGFTSRPRNLLLFVNPYGGNKRGLKIYDKHVKPLFEIAGIDTKVVITQRANHARDSLLTFSFDNFDGIACIGGDGTFAEVFNGLVLRTAKDEGIDYNDPEARIPSPRLRVGVIPAGSTDTMAYCFHGTTDIPTAVLQIILGDSHGLDLCSVHSNAQLLRYYSSVISYGYLGDVLRESEKFRWMGPKRYEYSGIKKFMSNNGYEGEIIILSDGTSASGSSKCRQNCERCHSRTQSKTTRTQCKLAPGELKTFRGKYFMVNGANVSCACNRSPNGISPHTHLGDGCVDVIMIKHTNMINNLKLLLRIASKTKNLYDLPFVEIHRAREFTFRSVPCPCSEVPPPRLIPGVSVWNCDGEVQYETNIKVRVHCQLLQVFTRGFPEEEKKSTCKCC